MRLLHFEDDGGCRLVQFVGRNVPPYAILSHTWGLEHEEVNFQDIEYGTATHKPGYFKIQFCGTQALNDGLQYFWVDTCCIDKTSSAELSEALNSMFRWYKAAAKCYVYLSDITTEKDFCQSRWFSRGWTLQELLAPSSVEFFSRDGKYLGDKKSLELRIQKRTGIALAALQEHPLSELTVAERMSWIAGRETTLEEDRVYCLLGIFDIYMPVLYGEGAAHALRRLQKEVSISASQPLLDDLSLQEKTDACLTSLAATDQTRFVSQTLNHSRHACSWVSKHPQYSAWYSGSQSSLLWITANAGCGKTTVAAHISQMVRTDTTSSRRALAQEETRCFVLSFFFRKSSQGSENTALAALRTIASQLARQEPRVLPILIKRFEMLSVKGTFEWPWDNLAAAFSEMLDSIAPTSRVCIVIDAVDECGSDSTSRTLLLDWLKDLVPDPLTAASESRGVTIKVVITSRPGGEALSCLEGFPTLAVTDAETADDVRALVRRRLGSLARRRHLEPVVVVSIERFLLSNARGMFIWVVMIIEELERRDERLSNEVIAAKLSRIPLSIADTYEIMLRDTLPTRKKDMWMIIRWLLFGSRSLTVTELEKGLCLEMGAFEWFGFAGDLDFLCGSLIRLDGPREGVTFAHQTVRSFLQAFAANSNPEDVAGVDMDPIAANGQLATVCLQYLLQDRQILELHGLFTSTMVHSDYLAIMEGFVRQNPFFRYTIESWTTHIRATGTPSPEIVDMLRQLVTSERRMQGVMIFHYFINKHGSWRVPQTFNPLHTAAYFNLHWLLDTHPEYRLWLNDPSETGDTPLVWASEMGSTEFVKKLLEMGADPNLFEYDGWSALHWAARNGHVQVAILLLSHGARLNQKDGKGHTPLDWALDRGFWDVVDILRQRMGPAGLSSQVRRQDNTGADGSTRALQRTWQLWDDRP